MGHVTREEAKACVGKGWHKFLDDVYDVFDRVSGGTLAHKLADLVLGPSYEIVQVKEKFGSLNIYFSQRSLTTTELDTAIKKAEAASMRTCEFCGAAGTLNDRYGWLKTTCSAHDKWRDDPPRGV